MKKRIIKYYIVDAAMLIAVAVVDQVTGFSGSTLALWSVVLFALFVFGLTALKMYELS